jgi:hypothetical protein
MCFLNIGEQAYLEQKEPFSNLKSLIGKKDFLKKLTHF